MKACKSFKRFLSVLLSVAMVVGMITVTGPQKVEAAGENVTVVPVLKQFIAVHLSYPQGCVLIALGLFNSEDF